MQSPIYNWKREKVGAAELSDRIFGARWSSALVSQVFHAQMANRRHPWAHTKDRSDVAGGGIKPWRQKGTGRARHGSIRSPLWRHGGVAHGPRNERDYTETINKKMRRAALSAVLSKKLKDGELVVLESAVLAAPKTKLLSEALRSFLSIEPKRKKMDALLIAAPEDKTLFRAGRNISKTKVLSPVALNLFDLMNYKNIIIDKNALPVIERHFSQK